MLKNKKVIFKNSRKFQFCSKKTYPNKKLGQHFLNDEVVIKKILNILNPLPNEYILEIGPGLGALTLPLLSVAEKLYVVEIDKRLIKPLSVLCTSNKIKIYNDNILNIKLSELEVQRTDCKKILFRIIGNLPYNISTPLLFHLIEQSDYIMDIHCLLQQELVERLIAKPGSKKYGRLSIMVQYRCKIEKLFEVNPQSLWPIPKVQSAFIRIIPYKELPIVIHNKPYFDEIVFRSFSKRRKIISNSLEGILSNTQIEQSGINPNTRPEQLSIEDFVTLSNISHN